MSNENDTQTVDEFAKSLLGNSDEQPEQTDSDEALAEDDETDEAVKPDEDLDEGDEEQPAKADSSDFIEYEEQGQKLQVPKKEALEAWKKRDSADRDYTQKMQQLSEFRATEERRLAFEAEFMGRAADDISEVKQFTKIISDYEALPWRQLAESDPQLYTQRLAELNDYRQRKAGAENAFRTKYAQYTDEKVRQRQAITNDVINYVRGRDAGFTHERFNEMVENARKSGVNMVTIDQIDDKHFLDHWNTLHKKARAYDDLVKQKTVVQKKVAAAPNPVSAPKAQAATQKEQHQKLLASKKMNARDFARMLAQT